MEEISLPATDPLQLVDKAAKRKHLPAVKTKRRP